MWKEIDLNPLDWPKKSKFLLALILITVFLAGGGYYLYKYILPRDKSQKQSTTPPYRLRIGVLRFYGMTEGRPALSISADSLTIEKKKIGVFSFSLMNTARMENVHIHIYANKKDGNPDFSKNLSEETFKSFPIPVGNISSFEATPIDVTFYIDKIVVTEIHASALSLRLKNRAILFHGAVRAVSGQTTLTTEKLSFLPKEGRFHTDKPFTLMSGQNRSQGKDLATDIYLRPLKTKREGTDAK